MAIKPKNLKGTVGKSLISLIILLVFTLLCYFYQKSNFVWGEFVRICHNAYDTKVWLDLCFGPYYQMQDTMLWVIKIEVGLIILLAILFLFVKNRSASQK